MPYAKYINVKYKRYKVINNNIFIKNVENVHYYCCCITNINAEILILAVTNAYWKNTTKRRTDRRRPEKAKE